MNIDIELNHEEIDALVESLPKAVAINVDRQRLKCSVQHAMREYYSEQKRSTHRVRAEIGQLCDAAHSQREKPLADVVDNFSPATLTLLEDRRLARPGTNCSARLTSTEDLLSLASCGGRITKGRFRPSGRQSISTFNPIIWAPNVRRGRPNELAGRSLLMWLAIAYHEATGKRVPRRANHNSKGPFVRFVETCLRRMRARHDAVGLINSYGEMRPIEKPKQKHLKSVG